MNERREECRRTPDSAHPRLHAANDTFDTSQTGGDTLDQGPVERAAYTLTKPSNRLTKRDHLESHVAIASDHGHLADSLRAMIAVAGLMPVADFPEHHRRSRGRAQ